MGNWDKQDSTKPTVEKIKNEKFQKRREDIASICECLSKSTQISNPQKANEDLYEMVRSYIEEHGRCLYSDISKYLFSCDETRLGNFQHNIDALMYYAHNLPEDKSTKNILSAIDKLWDHSNLAQTQNSFLYQDDETFSSRLKVHMIPFEAKFAKEMNGQFISLIAIFTALSFIVFGGISSLDNIFSEAGGIPIVELIIVGCIWSLCISNLVFVFMFFVSKLTHISIKSSDKENASVGEKYPFIIWSNFVILLIFILACWIYFVDYSNSGGWLLELTQKHQMGVSLVGVVAIAIVFSGIAFILIKAPWKKNQNRN